MGRFIMLIRGLALIAAFVFVTSVVATSTAYAQQAQPSSVHTIEARDVGNTHFYTFFQRANVSVLRASAHRPLTFAEMTDPVTHGLVDAANASRIISVARIVCMNTEMDARHRHPGLDLSCDSHTLHGGLIHPCGRSDQEIAMMSIAQAKTFMRSLFPRECRSPHAYTHETGRSYREVFYPTEVPVTPGRALDALTTTIANAVAAHNSVTPALVGQWYADGQSLARSHASDMTPARTAAFDRAYVGAENALRSTNTAVTSVTPVASSPVPPAPRQRIPSISATQPHMPWMGLFILVFVMGMGCLILGFFLGKVAAVQRSYPIAPESVVPDAASAAKILELEGRLEQGRQYVLGLQREHGDTLEAALKQSREHAEALKTDFGAERRGLKAARDGFQAERDAAVAKVAEFEAVVGRGNTERVDLETEVARLEEIVEGHHFEIAEATAAERRHAREEHADVLEAKAKTIEQLHSQLDDAHRAIEGQVAIIASKDETIRARDGRIAVLDQQLDNADGHLQIAHRTIEEHPKIIAKAVETATADIRANLNQRDREVTRLRAENAQLFDLAERRKQRLARNAVRAQVIATGRSRMRRSHALALAEVHGSLAQASGQLTAAAAQHEQDVAAQARLNEELVRADGERGALGVSLARLEDELRAASAANDAQRATYDAFEKRVAVDLAQAAQANAELLGKARGFSVEIAKLERELTELRDNSAFALQEGEEREAKLVKELDELRANSIEALAGAHAREASLAEQVAELATRLVEAAAAEPAPIPLARRLSEPAPIPLERRLSEPAPIPSPPQEANGHANGNGNGASNGHANGHSGNGLIRPPPPSPANTITTEPAPPQEGVSLNPPDGGK